MEMLALHLVLESLLMPCLYSYSFGLSLESSKCVFALFLCGV